MVARNPAALVLFTCLLAMVNVWYTQPHADAATLVDPPPVQWKRSFLDMAAACLLERDDKTLWLLAETIPVGRAILGLTSEGEPKSTINLDRFVGNHFAATRDGGFIVTGNIAGDSPTRAELFVLKLDALGRLQWQRSFALDDWAEGVFVEERAGGGYIAIGTSRLNREPYGSSITILATDPNGAPIWQKRFTGLKRAEAHGAHRTSEGGYVVVGATQSDAFGGDDVLYVLRVTATGGVVWERHFGEIRYHVGGRVVVTRDGGCLIAASANRIDGSAYGGSVLLKLNSAGGTVWRKTLDSVASEAVYLHWFASVEELTDGGFLLGGMRAVGAVGQPRVELLGCAIRTDSLGEPVWVWLSDPAPAGPPAVTQRQIAIARATVDGGFAIVVNKGIDEGTGYRHVGCDVVRLRSRAANRPPFPPTNLAQVLPDGSTLPVGGSTTSGTVLFRATISDPDGDRVKFQVELRRLDELGGGFDETQGGLKESPLVSSGSGATATASGLIAAAYHWRARTVDERGGVSPWVEFGGNSTSAPDFRRGFWAAVVHPEGSGATIYDSFTPQRRALKSVPNQWVLFVVDTHRGEKRADGYIWWEVTDTTDRITGWTPASAVSDGTRFLFGEPEDDTGQAELGMRADGSYADTRAERVEIIRQAVEHYFGNKETAASLYSSDDKGRDGRKNALSDLTGTEYAFPIEVVFAMIAQESGGIHYSNDDDGVMQVTWGPNKGLASNIRCFVDGCWYYGNTRQSIYANVKDGLRVLRDFYVPIRERKEEREQAHILAVWKYNGGTNPTKTYCACEGDPFYLVHIGMRLSGDDLLEGKHVCQGKSFECRKCTQAECTRGFIACSYRDPVDPTVTEFGYALNSDLAKGFKEYQQNVSAAVCSDAEILVRDSKGRRTGQVGSVVVEEIPHSLCLGKAVVVFMARDEYHFEIVGVKEGYYSLVINLSSVEGAAGVVGVDIRVEAGSVHVWRVDWMALARGEKGVTVSIDQNGDGVCERTVRTGNEVRGDDFGVIPTGSSVNHGPNPVPADGCTFWINLPQGTRSAKLLVYNVAGRLVAEMILDPAATRYPATGRWRPVDRDGMPLANGPYVYVLIADGKVIGQGKMVIQR